MVLEKNYTYIPGSIDVLYEKRPAQGKSGE